MKHFIKYPVLASSTLTYKGYSIYQTDYGFKIYKNGKEVTNIEFETSDECIEFINDEMED